MATTADYLAQLQADKQNLVDILVANNIEATSDETFTTLVPKTTNMSGGGADFEITNAAYLFSSGARTDIINELCALISDKCTSFSSTFENASLREIPMFKSSGGKSFYSCFRYNSKIKTLPFIDTSNGEDFYQMCDGCNELEEFHPYNTSKGTNFRSMCRQCSQLKTFPEIDTSNATNLQEMLRTCSNLTTVALLDFSKATNIKYVVENCSLLTTLGGFKDLGKAYSTTSSANYSNYTLNLSTSPLLTHDSLMNVINNLYDISACNSQQLVLGATNLAKLTEEEISVAQLKNWSVS